MHNEFTAFITDEASAATIRAWAERQGFPPATTVQSGGAELLAATLESDAPSKFIIVDMDGHEQPIQIAARLVSLCGAAAKLVAIGSANDVGLYRSMLAAGMMDYLVKPLTPETLSGTLAQAARDETPAAKTESRDAKIIVVLGVRGGVGASSLAVNLGWLAAQELKRKTALLDLDLQFGTSALALDLEPGRGLRDILSSPQRVDSLMVASATTSANDILAVLSAEEAVDENFTADGTAVIALVKEMRPNYQAIIVDMPRYMLATQKRLLAIAHELVLVTEMSLVGIRDTLRVVTALKNLGSIARVTIVTTGASPQRQAAVDEATFAKGAKAKIDFALPDDHKNATAASNAGKTLAVIAPNSPITKVLRQIAERVVGVTKDAKAEKKKWWFG